jgi:beta-xylosidase
MFHDDDNRYYLYYVQYPGFRILVQPMASPLTPKGDPILLIQATEPWEKRQAALTEAPWMLKHHDVYYLLYSASGADTEDYAIGYATADSPLGPFTKSVTNPLMQKGGNIYGPGHCSVAQTSDGMLWMVYHQQKNGVRGWNRIICIDPIRFDENGELHGSPTRGKVLPAPKVRE